jgi:hypothetical protein
VNSSNSPAFETLHGEAGHQPASPSRLRRLAGVLCAVGAVALGVVACGNDDDEAVLEAPTATLDPALLPEGVVPPTPPASTAATSTTLELSPLAGQIGEQFSAVPPPVVDRPVPVDIRIDSIGVDTDPVVPVGLSESGELDVPGADEVGWYELGQTPDQPGATVLAAHVSWKGDLGVFNRLGDLEPGSEIFVTLSDGTQRKYIAWERTMYYKTELPYERIWTREGPEVMVLITCGGEFNPEIRRFKQNIVVYAVPAPLEG